MDKVRCSVIRILRLVPVAVWVIGIALAAALPLWQSGFLNTKAAGETPYLLARVHSISTALKDGVFPVRWMHDGAYGLGYPFFNFYGALPYYLASILNLTGFGIVIGLKITHTLGFITGAMGMYAWVRRHLSSDSAALVAIAAFTFAPMHMINIYVRGDSLSEFWAMGLFPVVLWAIDRVVLRPNPRTVTLLGICAAALIVSHNISALIFLPLAALYGIWMWLARPGINRFAALAAGGLLALLLSAWFWVPALAERSTVQTDGRMTEGYFYWGNHFLDDQLVGSDLAFDYVAFPPRLGLWQVILVGGGIGGAIIMSMRRRHPRRIFVWGALVFALSVVLTLSIASPAYEHISVLSYLQFTWRWLTITAISGAAVAAYAIEVWDSVPVRRIFCAAIVVVTIISGVAHLDLEFIPVVESDITAERLAEREYYSGDIGTTVTTEYLPAGMNPRIYSGPLVISSRNLKVLDGEASGHLVERHSARETWQVDVQTEQALVSVPVMYWPGWTAELTDGSKLETSAVEGISWVQMQIPHGRHSVYVVLRNSPIRWTANVLSLMGVMVGAIALWRFPLNLWQFTRDSVKRVHVQLFVVSVSALLVGRAMLLNDSSEGPTATQFWRNSYHHVYEDGLIFSDGTQLIDYDYPKDVFPGQDLEVSLSWKDPTDVVIELIPPLVNLWSVDLVLAYGSGTDTVSVPIPTEAAAGLYFVRLSHEGEIYDLTPIRIHAGERSPVVDPLADFGNALRLLDVRTEGLNHGRLNVYLQWQILREITQNYSFALRLYNPNGEQIAAHDGLMGGYGGYPPAYWQDHFSDWATLPGLDGIPPGDAYRLTITVYTPDGALDRTEIDNLVIRESPIQSEQIGGGFSGVTELLVSQVEQGDSVQVLCTWQGPVEDGWQVEWIFAEDYEVTTSLAPGARLDWWLPDQRYESRVSLPIPLEMEPKTYNVRWRIVDRDRSAVTSWQTTGSLDVIPTARTFVSSDMQILAQFGPIDLVEYDIKQWDNSLILDIVWNATANLQDDYTLFVHVMNPDDSFVVAQTDTMPRNGAYPVSVWLPGELVKDTVQVELSSVPSGEYVIGLGWYNPQDPTQRLEAFTASDDPLPSNLFVLPEQLEHP